MAGRTTKTDKPDPTVTTGGALAGAAAGAGIGGVAGGPVGAAVGAAIGGATGAAAGAAATAYDEDEFRADYDASPLRERATWEEVAPAYQYGWESYDRGDYPDRSWNKVSSHLKSGWSGTHSWKDIEPAVRTAWERRAQRSIDAGGQAVVPVVEEELKVGKRQVDKGGVRVETKVREKPVAETVHLREEKVKVERRPADREATAADTAFKEGTLELHESAEEAVVSKKARVVEEVVISKQASEHDETVRDTLRKTEVEVAKTPGTARAKSATRTTRIVSFDDLGDDFRSSFKTRYGKRSGVTYETYEPAYRYGYDLASDPKYTGKDWATVEPSARTHWESGGQGTWEDFKDAVRHAWDTIRGRD